MTFEELLRSPFEYSQLGVQLLWVGWLVGWFKVNCIHLLLSVMNFSRRSAVKHQHKHTRATRRFVFKLSGVAFPLAPRVCMCVC